MKKTVVHNDPLDKENQSRASRPGEIVVLEK
jgi:hypothetical protein